MFLSYPAEARDVFLTVGRRRVREGARDLSVGQNARDLAVHITKRDSMVLGVL